MAMLDTRQVLGQRLTSGPRTRRFGFGRGRRGGGLGFQAGFCRSDVARQGFFEQISTLGREGFTINTVAYPPQMGQLQNEGLNLGVGRVELGITPSQFLDQLRCFCTGVGRVLFQFGKPLLDGV